MRVVTATVKAARKVCGVFLPRHRGGPRGIGERVEGPAAGEGRPRRTQPPDTRSTTSEPHRRGCTHCHRDGRGRCRRQGPGRLGGTPWPGLTSPRLDLARGHAQARHRLVVETRIRGLLQAGRPMEAVDAVTPLVAEDPDAEVWHALLVRALHDAGRPRKATEAYLAARRHLRDELGVDPGEELREVYRRLLADRARTTTRVTARIGPESSGATSRSH